MNRSGIPQLSGITLSSCIIALLSVITVSSFAQNRQFILTGKITGFLKGYVHLNYTNAKGKPVKDSSFVQAGKFSFSGDISEPQMAYFSGKMKSQGMDDPNFTTFFIEPATITITVKVNDFKHAVITGSATQDEYALLDSLKKPVYTEMEPLSKAYEKINEDYMKAVKAKKSEAFIDSMHNKAADIHNQFDPYYARTKKIDYDFFASHPQSYVTLFELRFYVSSMSVDSAQLFYDRLGDKIQQSTSGKEIAAEIEKIRAGSPGSIAKDFTTKDINNHDLTLSSFKGKSYVLIDFWASWCVPCRHSNPHLIELFHKYHDRGFEVIGVSDDDGKPDVWKKAVEKDGVDIWHNVLRGLDWDKVKKGEPNPKDISEKFGIHSLQTKILIDKNGIIIGRYGEGPADEAALDSKLASLL
jgi:thiol-disulfide isomerase/thioredoxin